MLNKIRRCALLMLSFMHPVFAENVEITGTIPVTLPRTLPKINALTAETGSASTIRLLKLSLSPAVKKGLEERFIHHRNDDDTISAQHINNLPRRVQLGMNRVPPLNQGNHGTCVTFAATAAVDAILGKGDYISQLCQLELGTYLEHNSYTSSGWDGSWGRIILSQMDVFGFASKAYQRSVGCGGIQEYPLSGDTPSAELSLKDFHVMSESLDKNQIAWSSILEISQLSSEDIDVSYVLQAIKQALNTGDRLTFGVLLVDFDQGIVGAVGKYHQPFDTWTLTPEIERDIDNQTEFAGHEMVITGYDDDAVATDKQGRTYKGLLTLRNSWGANVGDGGNFYMTYDFFNRLTIEVQRIRHLA